MVHRPIFPIRRWYRCKFFAIYFWCIITTIHWIQFTTKFQQGQNLERSLLFKLNGWTLILHFRTRKSAPFNFSVMKLLTKGQRSVWSILPIKRRGHQAKWKNKAVNNVFNSSHWPYLTETNFLKNPHAESVLHLRPILVTPESILSHTLEPSFVLSKAGPSPAFDYYMRIKIIKNPKFIMFNIETK